MRILYIDIDSLRPDHLSCYGYLRQTSPNIDALAAEGVRFSNYYATDTPCLPSRTAFFLGQFGINTGVVNHGGKFADIPLQGESRAFRSDFARNTLASVLRQNGYHTASISPFPNRHTAYQIWYDFSETYDTGQGGMENADEMYPPAQRWLAAHGKADNWFLHLNLWDPHTPYDTPEAYGNPFAGEPIEAWITQDLIDRQNSSFGPHSATEVPGYGDQLPERWRMGVGHIKTANDAKAHLDGYDTGIHYADPYETTNLAGQRADILGDGLRRMDQWLAAQTYGSLRGDPFWGVIEEGGPLHANSHSPNWQNYLARLRATNRGLHADRLELFRGRPFSSGLE